MSQLQNFIWLSSQAFSAIVYLWYISVAILAFLVVAIIVTWPFGKIQHLGRLTWAFIPFALPLAALLCGTIFVQTGPVTPYILEWPVYIIYTLLILHIPVSIFLTIKSKDYRFITAALSLLSIWFLLMASFVSIMSITGDWL